MLVEPVGNRAFRHAWRVGLEGIVSKRKNSTYRSGRSPIWVKMKNPAREPYAGEEEWVITVLTMRREHGEFVVTGPDIHPVKFRTRREARDWCVRHYSGSPIKEQNRPGEAPETA